ncbi:MAG: Peptide chain release factor 1 [candidate division TM6 bacterium GW2011_GWF2_43_17]|nr:MAG: Peptide chain release factor 1 [candidate division TM6 bacterium GW2011_GWF2_43_17]HAU30445.1 peptide chain release factor 1 [Candidatus Dependentiae bacterium]
MIYPDIPWEQFRTRLEELRSQLLAPSIAFDVRAKIQKEESRLSGLLEAYDALVQNLAERDALQEQCRIAEDAEFRQLCDEEISQLAAVYASLDRELNEKLYPPDERDSRSVFLEIRAGAGGQEAALFVADLARLYTMYGTKKNWHVSLVSESPTEIGGFREVVLHVEGKGVYGCLKKEAGVHRVQRVPKTETAGRVHTSTVTVAVLPEAEEVEFSIDPGDLRIDVYRASGAGGQHVNKTESAVRITHIPTGVVVACQEERSQHKNKAKAMKILQSKLLDSQQAKTAQEQSAQRREMVGTGERAEKVRTYNYPQNRVTDHQVGLTLGKLDIIMEGELDEIVGALRELDHQERRKHSNF